MVEFKSVAEIPKRPRTALTGHLSQMLAIVSFCGQRSLLLMAFAERRSKCACEGRCPGIERFNAVLLTVQPSPPRSSTCWPSAVCTVDESATCASLFHKCMVRIEAYNHQASHVWGAMPHILLYILQKVTLYTGRIPVPNQEGTG